jgi:hypothetical protein
MSASLFVFMAFVNLVYPTHLYCDHSEMLEYYVVTAMGGQQHIIDDEED